MYCPPCSVQLQTMWCPHLKPYGVHLETTLCPHRNHMVSTWKSCGDHMDTTCIPCGYQDMICYVTSVAIRSRKVTNLWMPVTSLIIVWFSISKKFWTAGPCHSPSYPWVGMMSLPCAILFRSLDWNGNDHIIPTCGNNGEQWGTTMGNDHVVSMWKPCSVHMETMWCPHLKPCGVHWKLDSVYMETMGYPHGNHVVSTWIAYGVLVETMLCPPGNHVVSTFETMWCPPGN